MPYEDDEGLVECGHGDESYCAECGGCLDCSNCYCDEDSDEEHIYGPLITESLEG